MHGLCLSTASCLVRLRITSTNTNGQTIQKLRMEKREHHLVVGGGGYPGWRLAVALAKRGLRVTVFDVRAPADKTQPDINIVVGDVTNYNLLKSAFSGVDCVYHMASFGMSGRDQLNRKAIESVNVTGTENVIKACHAEGVTRLVYTSTYNVVFGGQEIRNGDESLEYLPMNLHVDHYSRTKAVAEMKVLAANSEVEPVLRTCALRLAGVYGPGEERHLPRVVKYIKRGLFTFTYGSRDSLVDFLHVDNLVQAHMLAGEALSSRRKHIAAGQAYFISDDKPVNNFEFFRPLVEGLGYTYPRVNLPMGLIYFFALITELVHGVVGRIYNFQPLLTRAEVYKTGVTHYFNLSKAKKELGYKPIAQNDMVSALKWYLERGYHRNNDNKHSQIYSFILSVLIAAAFLFLLLSLLPVVQ